MWFRFTGLDVFRNKSTPKEIAMIRNLTRHARGRKRSLLNGSPSVSDSLIDEDVYLSCVACPQTSGAH